MPRTTDELQKDADEVINTEGVYHYCEIIADKKVKNVELYEMTFKVHPVDVKALISELSAKLREEGYNYMGAMADNDHLVETIRNATDLDKLKALTELNYPTPPKKEQD